MIALLGWPAGGGARTLKAGQPETLRSRQRVNSANKMKRNLSAMSQQYVTALKKHPKQGPRASLEPARGLGRQAVAIGLETLDVARMHEGGLATLETASRSDGIIKRAEILFFGANLYIMKKHRDAD